MVPPVSGGRLSDIAPSSRGELTNPLIPGHETPGPTRPEVEAGRDSLPSEPTEADWRQAEVRARLCEDFLRLTKDGTLSLCQAARALRCSPSYFSGAASPLARFLQGGVSALLTIRPPSTNVGDVSAAIERLGWFLPAARFFYLITNRTRGAGSVPEAIRRTISLPAVPVGWQRDITARLIKIAGTDGALPICPAELRETLLAREKAGRPFVTDRIARKITSRPAVVRQSRNPTNAALDYLNVPGGLRMVGRDAERRLARAGDVVEMDDATINFPCCVPWTLGGSPCADKFGVMVGRFQWLVAIDAGTSFIPAYTYTARPRSSYRAEDILSLMRIIALQHGVPATWRLERGTWESNLVTGAISNMGSRVDNVYSPHSKAFIEGLFNVLWTKLSVHFPNAHIGRFRGEHEAANDLLTACHAGRVEPRKHFPMLADAMAAFGAVVAEKNRTPVTTAAHGRWVPEDRWAAEAPALRKLAPESEWLFSPFVRTWKVRGMLVGGRIPVFEDISIPFDFSAPWLPQWDGHRVKCYFDPGAAKCTAAVCLAESVPGHRLGEVLGTAAQVNEAAGYVRLVMGWGDDPEGAGRKARQVAAAAMRREVRAILPRGQGGASASEERDGLSHIAKIESSVPSVPSLPDPAREAAASQFEERNALDWIT